MPGRAATGRPLLLASAALLPLLVAGVIDVAFGVEVTLLAKTRTPAERTAWRDSGWDPRDGVPELYGVVEPPEGLRVIVWDHDRLVHPPEDASLALLPIDRAAGEDPLPARALWLRAGATSLLLVLLLAVVAYAARMHRRNAVRLTLCLTTLTLMSALLAGCGGKEAAPEPTWAPITQNDMTESQLAQQSRGNQAKGELFARLFTRLQQAFAKGPGEAIAECKLAAPEIAEAVSSEKTLKIGRTSHKLRNPANVPPSWAAPYVEERRAEPLWLAHPDGRLAGLLPIKVMPLCLRCHGEKASIEEPILEALAEGYPGDNATGFRAGDLRGWFWLEIPAD